MAPIYKLQTKTSSPKVLCKYKYWYLVWVAFLLKTQHTKNQKIWTTLSLLSSYPLSPIDPNSVAYDQNSMCFLHTCRSPGEWSVGAGLHSEGLLPRLSFSFWNQWVCLGFCFWWWQIFKSVSSNTWDFSRLMHRRSTLTLLVYSMGQCTLQSQTQGKGEWKYTKWVFHIL